MKLHTRARTLLTRAAAALEDETQAAGPDETKQHPTLRAHARLAASIRQYLKQARPYHDGVKR